MKEKEFRELAAKMGYLEDEIDDLVEFSKETKIPFDEIILAERIVD